MSTQTPENVLPRRRLVLLLVIGLLIMLVSLAALIYAAWPVSDLVEHLPLSPTLFTSP